MDHLLVRGAGPGDQQHVVDILGRAGWDGPDLAGGAPTTLVLFDPADGVVRGAILMSEVAAGSFELRAWAVEDVPDGDRATSRLVRAAADHLRRVGGERLVVKIDGVRMAVDMLTAAGFGTMPPDPDDPGSLLTLYQEL